MIRFASAGALIAGATLAAQLPANAAQTNACELTGAANFAHPVTTAAAPNSYTFSGSFTNCGLKDSNGTPVHSGSVTASGDGTVGCAKSNTNGVATITWDDGLTSTLYFNAKGAGSGVVVSGPITGGEFAGRTGTALLSFTTNSPQSCASGGLSTLPFVGVSTLK
jgi:hypothetical protein